MAYIAQWNFVDPCQVAGSIVRKHQPTDRRQGGGGTENQSGDNPVSSPVCETAYEKARAERAREQSLIKMHETADHAQKRQFGSARFALGLLQQKRHAPSYREGDACTKEIGPPLLEVKVCEAA